jgi:hypothetical protein
MCEEAGWIDGGAVQSGPKVDDLASDLDRWLREWNDKGGQTLLTEWREGAAAEGEKSMPEASMPVGRVGRLDRSALEAELLRREREALHTELTTRDATIRDLQEQLEERTAEAKRSQEQLAAVQEQLAAVQEQLEGIQQERKALHSALATLPAEATVLVVSKGDEELLELDGRKGWHFPQTEDGTYAGHYPADGAEAITHLETLRAKGGDFLLFPNTACWWLDHYEKFKQRLDACCGRIWEGESCLIYKPFELGHSDEGSQ